MTEHPNACRSRVLIVDDEPDIRELLTHHARRMDLDSRPPRDVAGAQRAARQRTLRPVPDGHAPAGRRRLELRRLDADAPPGVPVAVITAHGNVETAVRALKLGAFDFVSKPLDLAASAQARHAAR